MAEVWFQHAAQIVFHDPLAAACIFEPDICTYRNGQVTVSLNAPTQGWTVFDGHAAVKPHLCADTVNAARFVEHYFSIVK